MKQEFISYEQSLCLKQLGFDELCFGYYTYFYKQDLIKEGVKGCMNSALEENEIAAPLYQQAFRWFRDKYNLVVNINTMHLSKGKEWDCYISKISAESSSWEGVVKGVYEETELECLKKLIEIVKVNINNKVNKNGKRN
jgi:hypothetical protein